MRSLMLRRSLDGELTVSYPPNFSSFSPKSFQLSCLKYLRNSHRNIEQTSNTTTAPTHPRRLTNTNSVSPTPQIQGLTLDLIRMVPVPHIPISRQRDTTGQPHTQLHGSKQWELRSTSKAIRFCILFASGAKQM